MVFSVDGRISGSPLIETVWRAESQRGGSFTSLAASHSELVVTRHKGVTTLTMRGPETRATSAVCPEDAEFFGITFKLGVFMPELPPVRLADRHTSLRLATRASFWLGDQTWQIPVFDEAEAFVECLVRRQQLQYEPMIEVLLDEDFQLETPRHLRTLQRRFQAATGLSLRTVRQIERARRAVSLLESGVAISDVIYGLKYSDQPHLTKTLKYLVGNTPARIAQTVDAHSPLTTWESPQRPHWVDAKNGVQPETVS
jgi:AraC-like DNA-binding protein